MPIHMPPSAIATERKRKKVRKKNWCVKRFEVEAAAATVGQQRAYCHNLEYGSTFVSPELTSHFRVGCATTYLPSSRRAPKS
jgi:hypothetical protein